MITLLRGNTYDLPITLKIGNAVITGADVKKVEFFFGCISKKYPENVSYENNAFLVHLSQEDTLQMPACGHSFYQARVLFNSDKAKSTKRTRLAICDSMAKEVLK